jgi:hypothetical protein
MCVYEDHVRRYRVDCARYTFRHGGHEMPFLALLPAMKVLLLLTHLP